MDTWPNTITTLALSPQPAEQRRRRVFLPGCGDGRPYPFSSLAARTVDDLAAVRQPGRAPHEVETLGPGAARGLPNRSRPGRAATDRSAPLEADAIPAAWRYKLTAPGSSFESQPLVVVRHVTEQGVPVTPPRLNSRRRSTTLDGHLEPTRLGHEGVPHHELPQPHLVDGATRVVQPGLSARQVR